MANDGSDRTSRMQRLLQLSDELKELSDLVQKRAEDGSGMPAELLMRNRELVRRCDDLASSISGR